MYLTIFVPIYFCFIIFSGKVFSLTAFYLGVWYEVEMYLYFLQDNFLTPIMELFIYVHIYV